MIKEVEYHPLTPFLPKHTQLLMLGSFPPKKERWKMDFYYPNFQNDMWRIFGICFFDDKEYFLTEDKTSFNETKIKQFLNKKRIGISDVAKAVIRHKDNASDKFLEIVEIRDIDSILKTIPDCKTIVTTGQKATDTLLELFKNLSEPKIGHYSTFLFAEREIRLYRMPSSSRAYPKSLVDKANIYSNMFKELDLL